MNQILIVDNQPENCEAIADMLSDLKVSLLYCHRGEDALPHIRSTMPSLVLLDADMPGMDGYQVINQMWADDDLRQVPVLLMTTHFADRKQQLHQPLLEVVDALPKPINPRVLQERVRMALTLKEHQKTIVSVLEDGGQAIRKRHEAVLAVDGEGCITFANATALALLRTNHQEIFGVYLESIFEEPNHHARSAWLDHPVQRMCSQGNVLQVESCVLYCADGNTIMVKMAAIPMTVETDIALVIAFRQIAKPGAEDEQGDSQLIQDMNCFDSLTGTYIRQAFEQVIDDRIQRNKSTGKKIAVLQIDLAHFNHVNETLGHEVGDQMLKDVVARLQRAIRPTDRIGRIGGDVFAAMVDDVPDSSSAGRVAQKITETLCESFLLEGFELFIGCNIGIATYPECGKESGALLKNSAIAVEGAKLGGSNSYQFFTAKMNQEMLNRIELESSLHHSLDRGELEASISHLSLASGSTLLPAESKVFALRFTWNHPRFGCHSTAELLELFERYSATELYRRATIDVLTQFSDQGDTDAILLVPVSLRLFIKDDLIGLVQERLPNLKPHQVGWLLQENGLGRTLVGAQARLNELSCQGYRLGIESNTGDYVSSCLTQLNLGFVVMHSQLRDDRKSTVLRKALIGVAQELDVAVFTLTNNPEQ